MPHIYKKRKIAFCTLAGMAGLEPASEGVKVPCLTTWLHPYVGVKRIEPKPMAPALRLILLGWVMGFEPTTPGTTIRCSNQLSYTHHIKFAEECQKNGTPEGTRTPDPLLRRQLLYPPELQAHMCHFHNTKHYIISYS